jgi:hypothetical protein
MYTAKFAKFNGQTITTPYHPTTQGKMERWHNMVKNRICWKTVSYPAILRPGSKPASSTNSQRYHENIVNSPWPTSTLDAAQSQTQLAAPVERPDCTNLMRGTLL